LQSVLLEAGFDAFVEQVCKPYKLGARNERGQDYANAQIFYRMAADADHAGAMVRLGKLYEDGRGVPPDNNKARGLYEQAARMDSAEAMFDLGALYESGGGGMTPDTAKAIEWFQRAAALGHAEAMSKLAALYDKGAWVAPDLDQARAWYDALHLKTRETSSR
jgi:TPR repeat protein